MNLLASMRYLVALEEHKHFGRAAQACFVTQPALSNAIRAMEEEFGSAIVKRGRSFVGFTPEGERLLVSARRMLREESLLRQEFASRGGRPQGRLTIGVVPSAEPIAARFAARLQGLHPGIMPVVRSMSSPEIEAGLDDYTLDLGLGFIERERSGHIPWHTLLQYTEHYFLVSKTAETAHTPGLRIAAPVSWQQAATQDLCLMTPEMHHRHIVESAFKRAGVKVQPVLETNSILSLMLSVLAGSVACVMPGALVGVLRPYADLQACPLTDPDIHTPVGFMVPPAEKRSRPLEAALALAQDAAWLRHATAHTGLLSA